MLVWRGLPEQNGMLISSGIVGRVALRPGGPSEV